MSHDDIVEQATKVMHAEVCCPCDPQGCNWTRVREVRYARALADAGLLAQPHPEPDWLEAPAVLAAMDDCSWQKVWLPSTPGHWECTCCGVDRHWSKMNDVTPLYPEEDKGGMYITGSGEIQFKDRNGQIVWEI